MKTSQFTNLHQCQAIFLEESLKESVLPAHLIQNYLNTVYQANSHLGKVTLRINEYCDILSQLMSEAQQISALYITAYNPHSHLQSTKKNDQAQNLLYKQLMHYSTMIYSGESVDPTNNWPTESSYLALGIELPNSIQLGSKFKQNAIVWCNDDAIPRLILLR